MLAEHLHELAPLELVADWHLAPDPKRRRPSFVPWHTQAYFIVWETLRSGAAPTPAVAEGEGESPAVPAVTPEGWPVGTTPPEPVEVKPEELEALPLAQEGLWGAACFGDWGVHRGVD